MHWVSLPFLVKDKRDPYEPSGTRWTSEIAMTNLDMTPGISVWRMDFFDQNGLLYSICQTLNEKQVDYVKLGNIGIIPPGWLGSAIISRQCASPAGAGALGVVVVEKASGYASGDLTKAYEGFPIWLPPDLPWAVTCPECANLCPTGRIWGTVTPAGATVQLHRGGVLVDQTVTTGNGYYEFTNVPAAPAPGMVYRVVAQMAGYTAQTKFTLVACGAPSKLDFQLVACATCTLQGTARVLPAGFLVGSTVELWKLGELTPVTTKTDSEGKFKFEDVTCGAYHLKIIISCNGQSISFESLPFAWVNACPAFTTWTFTLDPTDCKGGWLQP